MTEQQFMGGEEAIRAKLDAARKKKVEEKKKGILKKNANYHAKIRPPKKNQPATKSKAAKKRANSSKSAGVSGEVQSHADCGSNGDCAGTAVATSSNESNGVDRFDEAAVRDSIQQNRAREKQKKRRGESSEANTKQKKKKGESKKASTRKSAKKRKPSKAEQQQKKRRRRDECRDRVQAMLTSNQNRLANYESGGNGPRSRMGADETSAEDNQDSDADTNGAAANEDTFETNAEDESVQAMIINYNLTCQEVMRNKAVNVLDMMNCYLPNEEANVKKYLNEAIRRALICLMRDQWSDAFDVVNRAIVCHLKSSVVGMRELEARLLRLRMHIVDKNPHLLSKAQIVKTVKYVMRATTFDTLSDELLRYVYGENQSAEKLALMVQQFHDDVIIGNCPLPQDLVDIIHEVDLDQYGITDVKEDWSRLALHHDQSCDHCKRVNCFSHDQGNELAFDFYETFTDNIAKKQCKLTHLETSNSRRHARKVHLCSECHLYLWRRKNWKNEELSFGCIWPIFYYDLLSGRDAITGTKFTDAYSGSTIWRLFPDSLRKYYRPQVAAVLANDYPFVLPGQVEPPSYFRDITAPLRHFKKQLSEYTFNGMLSVLEPSRLGLDHCDGRPMMLPDCRCPWGCSEFSFATSHLNSAILLQHLLSKVQLNMPTEWYEKLDSVETMRLDYIRQPNEEDDCVLLNKSWPILVYLQESQQRLS